MSKINQYQTDDTAADANIFNFWDTALGKVRKTTWGNLVAIMRTALSTASGTVKGVIKLYDNVTGSNTDGAPDQSSVKTALANKADLVAGKVPVAQIPETHFKGKYIDLAALQTAYPTASNGDYAIVDSGGGSDAQNYIWDTEEGWVASGVGGGVTSFASRVGGVTPQSGDYDTSMVGETTNKNYLPDPVTGWSGGSGVEVTGKIDINALSNADAITVASHFNALIATLKTQKVVND